MRRRFSVAAGRIPCAATRRPLSLDGALQLRRAGGGRGGAREGGLAGWLPRSRSAAPPPGPEVVGARGVVGKWWETRSVSRARQERESCNRPRLLSFFERDIGFEPTTFSLGRAVPEGVTDEAVSQDRTNLRKPSTPGIQATHRVGSPDAGFATRLLPGPGRRLRAHPGGQAGRLLSIVDVAEVLAVSTATVYKLVGRGALRCVRVLNAIRVRREDLDAFERATAGGSD